MIAAFFRFSLRPVLLLCPLRHPFAVSCRWQKKWQNKEWPVHNDAFLWGPSTSGTLYVSEELADKLKKSIHDILNRENE